MPEQMNTDYEEIYSPVELTPAQFIAAATATAKSLGWSVTEVTEKGLVMYTNNDVWQYNARVAAHIATDGITIISGGITDDTGDWNKNKEVVARFMAAFRSGNSSVALPDAVSAQSEVVESSYQPSPEPERKKGVWSLFVPVKGFTVTPLLIDLNIIIFLLMVISGVSFIAPDTSSLLNWGANFRPYTLDGQWWRLLTNCFLHIGIIHLAMNMYALVFIGALLEPHLGTGRFIAAYLLTGIAASVASLSWHSATVSAGASGAIFGMYGVFLAMLTTDHIEKTARKKLLASIGLFVFYNLAYGMKGGIDNAAHIGGLISGLVVGYAFMPGLRKTGNRTAGAGAIALVTIGILVVSALVVNNTRNDVGIYEAKMKRFDANEKAALAFYKLPTDSPKEMLLSALKDKGIYYWQQSMELLKDVDNLDLPDVVKKRNEKLKEYCNIRLESYQLLYKKVSEETDDYDNSIRSYNEQLESLLHELNGEKENK